MNRNFAKMLMPLLLMPLLGTTCFAVREFQVRPYTTSSNYEKVTLSMLVDDFSKVAEATAKWATQEKLEENPCRNVGEVPHLSPACRIFRGQVFTVSVVFTPRENSTSVSVISNTHKVAEDTSVRLREYLVSQLGRGVIADVSGGEVPNNALKSDLGDAARPSAP